MRNIINISLPLEMVKVVKQEVKLGKYASISEFFRHLVRTHEENKILGSLEESRRDIKVGRGKGLRSLKSLR